eukprot:841540-Prymnesium_polylepis.1
MTRKGGPLRKLRVTTVCLLFERDVDALGGEQHDDHSVLLIPTPLKALSSQPRGDYQPLSIDRMGTRQRTHVEARREA